MNEYHFSISLHGHFLFRTDGETDQNRVARTQEELIKRFPSGEGFRIARCSRSLAGTHEELES